MYAYIDSEKQGLSGNVPNSQVIISGEEEQGSFEIEIVDWNKGLQFHNVFTSFIQKSLKQSDRVLTFVNSQKWIHGCLL